jgi:hypothetical protein
MQTQTLTLTLDYDTILQAIQKDLIDTPKRDTDSFLIMGWLKTHCVGLSIDDREKLMFKLRQALWG